MFEITKRFIYIDTYLLS